MTEARGDTQREAFAACSALLAKLTAVVAEDAGPGAEVSATGVYVTPEWDERGRRRTGYRAGASVTIRAGLEEAGRLGQAALDGGAIRLEGPAEYEIGEPAAVRDELLAEAVKSARATAERMAAADGRRVGAALRILNAPDTPAGAWIGAPRLGRAATEMQAPAPPVEPGAQKLEATVVVTFELLDAPAG